MPVEQQKVLLWHPTIHRLYNEDLYYFFLRFSPYNREALQMLKERLTDVGVSGLCLYEVFGDCDVLVRAWLTQTTLAEFYKLLDRYPSLVAYRFFRVLDQKHWAFDRDPDIDAVNRLSSGTTEIKRVQQAIAGARDETIDQYVRAGAAYYRPISDPGLVKFYTALTFEESGRLTIQQENEIRRTLFKIHDEMILKTRPQVRNASIYWGNGFANALLKGMCRNVLLVRNSIVDEIIPRLSGFFPTSTTFIICDRQPYESDNISEEALATFMKGTPPAWIQSWFPDFYKLGADIALTTEVQLQLTSNLTILQSLSEESKREVLRPFLEGVLTSDSRIAVRALLPWFAEAELFLRDNWFRFLGAVTSLEGEVLKEIDFAIRKYLGLLKESGKEVTLGDRLNMYFCALEKYRPKSPLLVGPTQAAELTEIRNQFAHGVMFRYASLLARWKEILRILLWFLPRYEEFARPIKTAET